MSLIGKQINGFKLLRINGPGGMGEVYYAFNEGIKREAAVKVLYQKSMFERFKNEAYILVSENILYKKLLTTISKNLNKKNKDEESLYYLRH